MALLPTRSGRRALIPVVLFFLIAAYFVWSNFYQLSNTLSYSTRPLWDKADGPSKVIPHYYTEGMPMNEYTCSLHGWNQRDNVNNVQVLDAVLMSSELDLLEIRLEELDSVVDRFFILESNATFTGLPKETYFANNRARYAKFEHKITYTFLPGHALVGQETAWTNEARHRDTMTLSLHNYVNSLPAGAQPVVVMSDIDEIPSKHTLRLVRQCNFGMDLHLQLKNYLYSFEWFLGYSSWRSSVHLWHRSSYYRHSKSTNIMLADSGWHCSYCFRTIPEYVVKMKGFSHSDRIGGRINLLEPKRIQDVVCKGKDIFGMLPEAYRYADLLSQLHLEPQTSAVGLPQYLLLNAARFKFLLPGGCKRDDIPILPPVGTSK